MNNRRLFILLTLFALLALTGGLVFAETGFGAGFAAVSDGQLIINTGGDVYFQIATPPNRGFNSIAWNADGSLVAFILYDEQFTPQLYVVEAEMGSPVLLAAGRLEAGFPVSFTPEGRVLYAQSTYDPNNPTPDYKVNFNTIAPQAGATPETLGTVAYGVGCGGGSPLPADWQYWAESGFGGSYLTLRWTDYGIMHSVDCAGHGLGLLNPATSEVRQVIPVTYLDNGQPIPENYGRIALSPDGQTAAMIKTEYAEPDPIESLALVDLASGTITAVPTVAEPDQVAWAADGTLYYSSYSFNTERTAQIAAGLSAEQRERIELFMPVDLLPIREIAIHHLDPVSAADSVIHTADAYAVGRMRLAHDGSLWFSQVANLDRWAQGLADGTLDIATDTYDAQARASVPVTLFRYDPASQTAEQVGENLGQFALQPAARG